MKAPPVIKDYYTVATGTSPETLSHEVNRLQSEGYRVSGSAFVRNYEMFQPMVIDTTLGGKTQLQMGHS